MNQTSLLAITKSSQCHTRGTPRVSGRRSAGFSHHCLRIRWTDGVRPVIMDHSAIWTHPDRPENPVPRCEESWGVHSTQPCVRRRLSPVAACRWPPPRAAQDSALRNSLTNLLAQQWATWFQGGATWFQCRAGVRDAGPALKPRCPAAVPDGSTDSGRTCVDPRPMCRAAGFLAAPLYQRAGFQSTPDFPTIRFRSQIH